MQDPAERVNERNGAAVRKWQREMQMQHRIDRKIIVDPFQKILESLAREAGHSCGVTISVSRGGFFRSEPINFI